MAKTDTRDVTTSSCSDNVTMPAPNADILTLEVNMLAHSFIFFCRVRFYLLTWNTVSTRKRKNKLVTNIHKVKM